MAPASVAQIIRAPKRQPFSHKTVLFLAGTTATQGQEDWRRVVLEAIKGYPVTVLDPVRTDWDDSWVEDVEFDPFRKQVEWELDMQEEANTIAMFFDPSKEGMVSLLELGLCARSDKAIVACPRGYVKRGNVQLVCRRFGIRVVDSAEQLVQAVVDRISRETEGK